MGSPPTQAGDLLFFFFLKFYLFVHEIKRERERQRHRQEKQALHKEPDAGLDPGTLGSCPEPKADTQLLSHPGNPIIQYVLTNVYIHVTNQDTEQSYHPKKSLLVPLKSTSIPHKQLF